MVKLTVAISQNVSSDLAIYALVGEHVGRGTLYLYELAEECVYLYVGRGRDGRGKVGRGKDVVPLLTLFLLFLLFTCLEKACLLLSRTLARQNVGQMFWLRHKLEQLPYFSSKVYVTFDTLGK